MRPEVAATGRAAAGDGVGEVLQRDVQITGFVGVQAKTVCRPGFPTITRSRIRPSSTIVPRTHND
jgi:hypothetical protein